MRLEVIARAALRRPQLIILDEATSSLEVEVEAMIMDGLNSAGATTILMAHRPEVWALADRIYTLEHGRLREETGARREVVMAQHSEFIPTDLNQPRKIGP